MNRKEWLKHYDKNNVLKVVDGDNKFSYSEFVDNELIHFSNADNLRSIPDVVDGLKTFTKKGIICGSAKLKMILKYHNFVVM